MVEFVNGTLKKAGNEGTSKKSLEYHTSLGGRDSNSIIRHDAKVASDALLP